MSSPRKPARRKKPGPALKQHALERRPLAPEKGNEEYYLKDLMYRYKTQRVAKIMAIVHKEYPRLSKAKKLQIIHHWLITNKTERNVVPSRK